MREQEMITGDWRSNWQGERAVPLLGSARPYNGCGLPPDCELIMTINTDGMTDAEADEAEAAAYRPYTARLESDLLAAGLRTRYCTDGDCLNRVTAPGAQTLCEGHRVIVYDPSKAPPMPGDDGADAAGLFHDSPHKDVGNGRAAKVVRNDRSAVTLACGNIARSGDRVVVVDAGDKPISNGDVHTVDRVDHLWITVEGMAIGLNWKRFALLRCQMGKHRVELRDDVPTCKRCGEVYAPKPGVTLACGGVARSGDRVVALDGWCRDPGTVMTVYDGHPPGDVTLCALESGGAEHFALLRDESETPVDNVLFMWRRPDGIGERWRADKWTVPDTWRPCKVQWFYLERPVEVVSVEYGARFSP